MISEFEKMINSENYDAGCKHLDDIREAAREYYQKYNLTNDKNILEKLFNAKLNGTYIRAPFYCDYGINIEMGKNVYMNFNCVILDCAKVKIGDNTFLAPNVQIYTACHPIDAEERITGIEFAKPVIIGKNCWIGGGAIILGGVTIGDNTIIGAGSVVTKSIPSNTLAYGNPCRAIKEI